jgi:hypothetical protein
MSKTVVPMPLVIGVVVAVVLGLSLLAWRVFQPPPEPMEGKSQAEKIEAMRKAQKELQAKDRDPSMLPGK